VYDRYSLYICVRTHIIVNSTPEPYVKSWLAVDRRDKTSL